MSFIPQREAILVVGVLNCPFSRLEFRHNVTVEESIRIVSKLMSREEARARGCTEDGKSRLAERFGESQTFGHLFSPFTKAIINIYELFYYAEFEDALLFERVSCL